MENYKITYGTYGQGNAYEIETSNLSYLRNLVQDMKNRHNGWVIVFSNIRQETIFDNGVYEKVDLLFNRNVDLRTKTKTR